MKQLMRFVNGENATEEVFMRYKPGKGLLADETTKGKTFQMSMKKTLHIFLTTEKIQVKF